MTCLLAIFLQIVTGDVFLVLVQHVANMWMNLELVSHAVRGSPSDKTHVVLIVLFLLLDWQRLPAFFLALLLDLLF